MKLNRKPLAHGAALTVALALTAFGAAQAAKSAGGETLAIVGATVFDATGAAPHAATVIIKDGRIAEVGPKVKVPRGAKVIDAKGQALLPGFFDLHTHWTPAGAPDTTPQIASAYVAAGVTTVSDFHVPPEAYAPRRQWLSTLVAPHVNFAARMSTPGGHGADWADGNTTKWVNTPEAARAAVQALAPYKPDLIKAFADGWRYGAAPDNTSMDAWTLSALVEAAHQANLKVFTHTVTTERGVLAAQAKVDVITHSLQDRDLAEAELAAITAGGVAITPTLAVYEPNKPGQAPRDPSDPRVVQAVRKFDHALRNAKRLHDAGVIVALGTDAGMPGTPHGVSTLREMELLVRAGLTPSQALIAGTASSAKVMDQLADRGTIEAGKRADLVLIKGRPWETIADVRNTDRVFIDGKLVFGPGAPPMTANIATLPPAVLAQAAIDDFERPDGRSSLDTLRTDNPDGGHDRTVEVSQVIARGTDGHALSVSARMAVKAKPSAGVIIPLSRGSVRPVDARAFKGVRFEIRGDGPYELRLNSPNGRWATQVEAGPAWRVVEAPFSSLKPVDDRSAAWTGADLTQVEFAGSRPGGRALWMEIDNVSFY